MAEDKGNPDAAQDESMINEWAQRELLPIFQQIKNDIDNINQVVNGIVSGFGEAVSGHRRTQLTDTIDLSDLGEIGDTYKDLEGSDMKEDLINHIMDSDIPDDQIEDILATLKENARAKYGKYKRADVEAPKPDGGEGVLAVSMGAEPSEEAPVDEEEEPKKADAVGSMMNKVLAVGKKEKLKL